MSHDLLSPHNETIPYYPLVSENLAKEAQQLWEQNPDLMRQRTRMQIGELSPDLAELFDILQEMGNNADDLPEGTGEAITEGMLQAFSMLYLQTSAQDQQFPELDFDAISLADSILPQWGLMPKDAKFTPRITLQDITLPFMIRNEHLAKTLLSESERWVNRTYFLAGASLVTQLYYEASHPNISHKII